MERRYWFPKHYADEVQRLRVPLGFAMAGAFLWLAEPTAGSVYLALPFLILGLFIRGWAAGHLAKNEDLAMSGPFAHVRNPLYLGTLTAAIGLAVAARSWWLALLFGVVFILVYLPAIELEEQHLRTLFPDYPSYASRVPLLMPTGRPLVSTQRFRPALYGRNQEYKAMLGFFAAMAFLAWRSGILRLP
ncbi:MAG: isoprenylcysteine carboxylmethyltransferase family protein [Bryobacteraceae bacterium]